MYAENSLFRGSHTAYAPEQISVCTGTSFPRQAPDQELGSKFDTYHLLAKVMWIVSNKLLNVGNGEVIMDILFTMIPKSVLLGLLNSGIPTVRGAWEALVRLTWKSDRKNDFSFLLKIAKRHPHWIGPAASEYLSYAASFGCLTSVKYLLAVGAQADAVNSSSREWETPIVAALKNANKDAAEMMIKDYDVNCKIWSTSWGSGSIFDIFTRKFVCENMVENQPLCGHENHALDMLLEAGADVVKLWEWPQGYCFDRYSSGNQPALARLWDQARWNKTSWPLPMTWLDYAYYCHIELYHKFDRYSKRSESEITRVGICTAVSQSTESLRQYFQSRPPLTPQCLTKVLECVLSEIICCATHLNLNAIQNLINYGVDVRVTSMAVFRVDTSFLFDILLKTIRYHGSTSRFKTIVKHFLQAGASIDSKILDAAVEKEGFYLLEILTDIFGANIQENGAQALARAAGYYQNEEAVKWLLKRGADVSDAVLYVINNGEQNGFDGTLSFIATAIKDIFDHEQSLFEEMRRKGWPAASPGLLLYLNEQAVRLGFHSVEMAAFSFLRRTLEHGLPTLNCQHALLQQKFQDFLDAGMNLDDNPSSQADLLELSLSLDCRYGVDYGFALFELLFRRGAPVRPGSPLTALIRLGGSHDLIEEVIEAGADINKVSGIHWHKLTPLQVACGEGDLELASTLLQRGADINAPALGWMGRTALQIACGWEPLHTDGEQRKTKLIRLLVDHGADVNSGPAPAEGVTALQIAATCGDLKTAIILLEHKADINAPAGRHGGYCALDGAAGKGRLDMVKFLLNANALSQYRGSTGYDGAIARAEEGGDFAVAELIRKHAADKVGWGDVQPHFVSWQQVYEGHEERRG